MVRMLKLMMFPITCLALISSPAKPDEASGRILGGSLKSPIRIEVFSDFQCGHCRDLYLNTIRPLLREYSSKDQVCVIYHEFPLEMHKYAREASRYSEAAAQMGIDQLLPVMDAIFTDQPAWAKDGSLEASVAKALPRDQFLKLKEIMKGAGIDSAIDREIRSGLDKKIDTTPTLLISYAGKNHKVEGVVPYAAMKQFIDSVLK